MHDAIGYRKPFVQNPSLHRCFMHIYLFSLAKPLKFCLNLVHALFGVEKTNMSQVVGILLISLLREKTNISVWLDHIVGENKAFVMFLAQGILIRY